MNMYCCWLRHSESLLLMFCSFKFMEKFDEMKALSSPHKNDLSSKGNGNTSTPSPRSSALSLQVASCCVFLQANIATLSCFSIASLRTHLLISSCYITGVEWIQSQVMSEIDLFGPS